jgi:hypothetical protein
MSDLAPICSEVMQIPTIFNSMLQDRIKLMTPSAFTTGEKSNLTKAGFLQWAKDTKIA